MSVQKWSSAGVLYNNSSDQVVLCSVLFRKIKSPVSRHQLFIKNTSPSHVFPVNFLKICKVFLGHPGVSAALRKPFLLIGFAHISEVRVCALVKPYILRLVLR